MPISTISAFRWNHFVSIVRFISNSSFHFDTSFRVLEATLSNMAFLHGAGSRNPPPPAPKPVLIWSVVSHSHGAHSSNRPQSGSRSVGALMYLLLLGRKIHNIQDIPKCQRPGSRQCFFICSFSRFNNMGKKSFLGFRRKGKNRPNNFQSHGHVQMSLVRIYTQNQTSLHRPETSYPNAPRPRWD
jgi:hypothetical protein